MFCYLPQSNIPERFMQKFADFGKIKDMKPEAAEVQNLVRDLQDYITQNFYQCSNDNASKLHLGKDAFEISYRKFS